MGVQTLQTISLWDVDGDGLDIRLNPAALLSALAEDDHPVTFSFTGSVARVSLEDLAALGSAILGFVDYASDLLATDDGPRTAD